MKINLSAREGKTKVHDGYEQLSMLSLGHLSIQRTSINGISNKQIQHKVTCWDSWCLDIMVLTAQEGTLDEREEQTGLFLVVSLRCAPVCSSLLSGVVSCAVETVMSNTAAIFQF